jgi:hypothetical protein
MSDFGTLDPDKSRMLALDVVKECICNLKSTIGDFKVVCIGFSCFAMSLVGVNAIGEPVTTVYTVRITCLLSVVVRFNCKTLFYYSCVFLRDLLCIIVCRPVSINNKQIKNLIISPSTSSSRSMFYKGMPPLRHLPIRSRRD